MSQNKPGPRELELRRIREERAMVSERERRLTKIKKEPAESPMPKNQVAATDTKKQVVASLLRRKNGCTSQDVKEATGWPSVSMPALAKSCGLKLTKEKTDKGFRYYGTPA